MINNQGLTMSNFTITFTITCAIKTNVTSIKVDNTVTTVTTQVQSFFNDGEQSLTVDASSVAIVKDFYVKLQDGREFGTLYGADELNAYLLTANCCNVYIE